MFISIRLCGTVGLSQFKIVEMSSTSTHGIGVAEDEGKQRLVDEVLEDKDDTHGGQPI